MKGPFFVLATVTSAATFAQYTVNKVKTLDQFHLTAAATSPVGSLVAFATEDNKVRVFDAATCSTRFQLAGHPQRIGSVAFNKSGTALATGDDSARIYLWNPKTGQKIREFPRDKGHTKGIIGIAFSSDGSRMATVGNDDVIKVWKTSGGNPIGTILGKGANLYGVAFTKSGGILTGTLADGLRLYSGTTFQLVSTMAVAGGQGVNNITANGDGSVALTAGRDGKLTMFSVPTRKKVGSFAGHNDWVINAAMSPNGKVGASASVDRTVSFWSLTNGKKLGVINDCSPVGSPIGFTGDGKYFIATSMSDGLTVFKVSPSQGGSSKPSLGSAKSKSPRRKK